MKQAHIFVHARVLFFQFYFCVVVIEKLKEKYSHETLGTFDADHWDFVERFTARHFTRMNVVQSTLYDILKCYDEGKGTKQISVRVNMPPQNAPTNCQSPQTVHEVKI